MTRTGNGSINRKQATWVDVVLTLSAHNISSRAVRKHTHPVKVVLHEANIRSANSILNRCEHSLKIKQL